MNKSYLNCILGLLLISSAYAAISCDIESGECGEQAISPSSYKAVRSANDDSSSYSSGYGCAASINISVVPGSGRIIVVDGTNYPAADYTVTVQNLDSCLIYSANVQIDIPSGGFILTTNNLNSNGEQGSGSYKLVVSIYGSNFIAPGSTYNNASFTAYFLSSGYALSFDASITAECPSSCIVQPQTSAGCVAATVVTQVAGSSGYNSTSGKYYAQYDVLIVNLGTCGIYEVGLDFSLPSGATISQTNGLTQTYGVGQYKATGFRNQRPLLMQGDTLASEDRSTSATITAEFDNSADVVQKFTVDSTAFCQGTCSLPLATPAPATSGCAAVATAVYIPGTARGTEVNGQNVIAVDYQVFVANYGQCSISSVSITFNPYSGSYVQSGSQLTVTTTLATTGATSDSTTVTVIFAATGYAYQIPISAVTPQCSSCSGSNGASGENNGVTEGCSVTASLSLRTSWKSGNTENRLYDFIITNTGSSAAQYADVSLTFSTASTVTQSWNLNQVGSSNVYRADLYAVKPNAVVRSSGFVLTIDESVYTSGSFTDPVISVSSTQC